jgi:hypothetical protein
VLEVGTKTVVARFDHKQMPISELYRATIYDKFYDVWIPDYQIKLRKSDSPFFPGLILHF